MHRWNHDPAQQRRIGVKSLVVALAFLLLACSSGSHHTAARPTTTTVPSTVQPTTTTAPTPVTEAALVGKWRPVSVSGYHGPLTSPPLGFAPLLSFDGKGRWSGSDGCDSLIAGSYQLSQGGTFHLAEHFSTAIGCLSSRRVPIPDVAVRVELLNGRLTFFDRNGRQLAQYERATVTARVALPSTTMTAGSSMTGHVIVENNTGGALHAIGCIDHFSVSLNNAKIHQVWGAAECLGTFTFPAGESSYQVTVQATYLGCGGSPLGDNPPCVNVHGHTEPPPLPPGDYEAKLFQSGNVVPTPPPITVRVTARR